MAWADSRVVQEWVKNPLFTGVTGAPTNYLGWATDVFKCALFVFTGLTPDRNAIVGSTGFNTGVWTTGNEKFAGAEWVTGGRTLLSKTNVASGGTVTLDAADLLGTTSITMTDVGGCMIYDDAITAGTVADQGMCFLYFGGTQSVTAGTFSVVFNATCIVTATV